MNPEVVILTPEQFEERREATRKMEAYRERLEDAEIVSVKNIQLAKSNLFMEKLLWAMQVFILTFAIIMVYVWMYNFFVSQSVFVVVGFWYLGIAWMPAGAGYVMWSFLAARSRQRKSGLLKDLREAEESHEKVMELKKNADTLTKKLEGLK